VRSGAVRNAPQKVQKLFDLEGIAEIDKDRAAMLAYVHKWVQKSTDLLANMAATGSSTTSGHTLPNSCTNWIQFSNYDDTYIVTILSGAYSFWH
jgi:hypothetical protein